MDLAKFFALVGIVTYAVGVLVVNGYLSQFGFADYSQLKPRFVATGALMLALVAVALGVTHVMWRLARLNVDRHNLLVGVLVSAISTSVPLVGLVLVIYVGHRSSNIWRDGLTLQVALLATVSALVAVRYLNASPEGSPTPPWLLTLSGANDRIVLIVGSLILFLWSVVAVRDWLTFLLAIVAVALVMLEWQIGRVSSATEGALPDLWREHRRLFQLITLPIAVALLVWSISLSGRLIYPLIPDRFGGGEPKTVQLGFTKDNAETASRLQIPIQPARSPSPIETAKAGDRADRERTAGRAKPKRGQISGDLCLLFEGEDAYLLQLPPRGAVLKVDRSLVSVIHVRLGPDLPC